jgi:hypothetical protein
MDTSFVPASLLAEALARREVALSATPSEGANPRTCDLYAWWSAQRKLVC